MKLESLNAKNYRGLEELNINFHPNITVIVGRNGSGKSTILEAVATMLRPLLMHWSTEQGRPHLVNAQISKDDIRVGSEDCSLFLKYRTTETPGGKSQSIELKRNKIGKDPANKTLTELAQSVQQKDYVEPENSLFVYYHQDRGFSGSKSESKDVFSIQSLKEASLQADLKSINDLSKWWDKLDAEEARQVRDSDSNYRDPQLEAIRKLIQTIDSFKAVSFLSNASPPGLYFKKSDDVSIHVNQLSSGERSYIILLADLARRLQVILPQTPVENISGVVLIDEIELNLHPAWQSEIIPTLSKTFKNCQFIVTTHSPQVISSVSSENVYILKKLCDGSMAIEQPLNTKGRTSNYLLEGIFGATDRFPEIGQLINKFNNAIEKTDKNEAKRLLEEIKTKVEGQGPDLIVLKKRLKKLELGA